MLYIQLIQKIILILNQIMTRHLLQLMICSIFLRKRYSGEIADNTLAGGESQTDVVGFQQVDDMIHTPVSN
jgi:hypothetical protein